MNPAPINRRSALKTILAAGGAITAVAILPEEWTDPVVKTGVLPVHAQASVSHFLSGYASNQIDDVNTITIPNVYALASEEKLSGGSKGEAIVEGSTPYTPVPGILVYLNYRNAGSGSVSNPDPTLKRSAVTDEEGKADFGDQTFTVGGAFSIYLIFTSPGHRVEVGPYRPT